MSDNIKKCFSEIIVVIEKLKQRQLDAASDIFYPIYDKYIGEAKNLLNTDEEAIGSDCLIILTAISEYLNELPSVTLGEIEDKYEEIKRKWLTT